MPTLITPQPEHIERIRAACLFPECNHRWCTPADVTPLIGYGFTIERCFDTDRGTYWEGTLFHDGTPFAKVINRGDGGANHYHGPAGDAGGFRNRIVAFDAAAQAAFNVDSEAVDAAVNFLDAIATTNA